MKILHLTLKKKWFDMIASGEKPEEYREIKPYWIKRLYNITPVTVYEFEDLEVLADDLQRGGKIECEFVRYTHVKSRNGYATNAPDIFWQHKGIRIGEGKEEWGAEKGKRYFVLEIGELLNSDTTVQECDASKAK